MNDHTPPMIRSATVADGAAIAAIYNHYVTDTIVTFEEVPVSADEMERRIDGVLSASLPWLVAEESGVVVGYAYATPWKPRYGYRFSREISVYLDAACGGRGIGSALYDALFPLLEAQGVHSVMAGIGLPNDGSIALHEKFGLQKVAHFKDAGIKFGGWIDVGYWQRTWPDSTTTGT